MSTRIEVDNIYDATRAYDTKTEQEVFLIEPVGENSNFFICEPYDEDKYIICSVDDLTDFHRM